MKTLQQIESISDPASRLINASNLLEFELKTSTLVEEGGIDIGLRQLVNQNRCLSGAAIVSQIHSALSIRNIIAHQPDDCLPVEDEICRAANCFIEAIRLLRIEIGDHADEVAVMDQADSESTLSRFEHPREPALSRLNVHRKSEKLAAGTKPEATSDPMLLALVLFTGGAGSGIILLLMYLMGMLPEFILSNLANAAVIYVLIGAVFVLGVVLPNISPSSPEKVETANSLPLNAPKRLAHLDAIADLDMRVVRAAALLECQLRNQDVETSATLRQIVDSSAWLNSIDSGELSKRVAIAIEIRNEICHRTSFEPTSTEKSEAAEILGNAVMMLRSKQPKNA